MKMNAKKIALWGVMSALAIVLGYLEHLVPFPIGIYGIKIGLANLAVTVPLYLLGVPAAITINVLRIALSSLLFGNTVSLLYSLAGGLLSILVMIIVRSTKKFSPTGVSLCGGIAHNVAQMTIAVFLVDNLKIAFYLPVLMITGALAGTLVGVCANILIKNPTLRRLSGI